GRGVLGLKARRLIESGDGLLEGPLVQKGEAQPVMRKGALGAQRRTGCAARNLFHGLTQLLQISSEVPVDPEVVRVPPLRLPQHRYHWIERASIRKTIPQQVQSQCRLRG